MSSHRPESTEREQGNRRRWPWLMALGGVFVIALAILFLWAYIAFKYPRFVPPSFEQVRKNYRRSDALLLDRHQEVIQELRVNRKARRLDWIPLSEISPALKSAVVFAEDRRFYQHHGIDWRAIVAAARGHFSSQSLRGASTITMQVAAKLNRTLEPQLVHRSLLQKWYQVGAARELDGAWSKEEILEAYLNLVSFRGELQGVAAASKGLFRKEPHGLNDTEAVILAALLRAPNAPIEQVAARACDLASSMHLPSSCSEITSRTHDVLSVPYTIDPEVALAPQVAHLLLDPLSAQSHDEPVRITSTLDASLQRFVIDVLQQHLLTVRDQNVHDAAVLVVDNQSGDVLAYVGNLGEFASARFVDGVQARRQAGSILKPFLYGLAIERRVLTAASLIDDAPLEIPAPNGTYRPENYDNQFHGLVTARVALASSLNIPAVKALLLLGVDSFVGELGQLGFRDLQSPGFYGPSLALGSADVTLWDLVNAYRSLANGGIWSPMRLTFDQKQDASSHRVLSPDAAFIVSDILSDRESRSETFSLESPLATRFWTAVKTGTSKDMRDNWCVGFSSRYTVGVWAGNFSGEPMWNVSGITGAAPVWVEIMSWLHHGQSSVAPKAPPGVISEKITLTNLGKSRQEWFIRGTETTEVEQASVPTNFHIVYPTNGMIVALDPDIPVDQQILVFESRPVDPSLRWILDGNDFGPAKPDAVWSPVQGKHTLALLDASRHVVDSVSFEVRGNVRANANGRSN